MSKGRILIIDDNPKNIQVAASILVQAGYETEFALNGEAGLQWLETEDFDLVLLDVMMPGMDGFQVCRSIKEQPRLQKTPVIFVTAKADRDSVVQGFEAGGEDYITKPYDARELEIRVKNQIELKTNRELLENMNKSLEARVKEKTENLEELNSSLEQTNSELSHRNSELQRLEESKQQFLNLLGNEVSGSLNDVTAMLQVIKYKVDSKKVAQLVDRIDHSLSKIEIFVNAALRITELQSHSASLKPERLEMGKLIGFAMFQLDEKIRRKQLKIDNKSTGQTVLLTGESQLLMAGLVIILDFFLERNEPAAVLSIEIEHQNNGVSLLFKDNGPPVSDQEIESYFDTFFTGNQSLNFARMIAEAHLGKLTVSNRSDNDGLLLVFGLYIE